MINRTFGGLASDPDDWPFSDPGERAKGTELGPVLETIERALRSHQALMIELSDVGRHAFKRNETCVSRN